MRQIQIVKYKYVSEADTDRSNINMLVGQIQIGQR